MSLKYRGNFWEPSDNAVGYAVEVGTFTSAAAGTGVALTAAKTKAVDVCCDDGGAALAASAVRSIRGRMLMSVAQSGAVSVYGFQGQVKNIAVDTTTGNKAGIWGYYESVSGATVANNSTGVLAMIDVPSGATIAADAVVSALKCDSLTLGGTHTGKAAAIHVPNPGAGTWDFFAVLGDTTGASATGGAGTCTVTGGWVKLPIRVGATTYYIPAGVTLSNS